MQESKHLSAFKAKKNIKKRVGMDQVSNYKFSLL